MSELFDTVLIVARERDENEKGPRDYGVRVDGIEVAYWSANGTRRGWRLYSTIDEYARGLPIREPLRCAYTPKHMGAECDQKGELESRVRELLEAGAPLTPKAHNERAESIRQARAQWAHDKHGAIAKRVHESNATLIFDTLKAEAHMLPLSVRRSAAAVVLEVESIINRERDKFDSAFADPKSVESYDFAEHVRSNL